MNDPAVVTTSLKIFMAMFVTCSLVVYFTNKTDDFLPSLPIRFAAYSFVAILLGVVIEGFFSHNPTFKVIAVSLGIFLGCAAGDIIYQFLNPVETQKKQIQKPNKAP